MVKLALLLSVCFIIGCAAGSYVPPVSINFGGLVTVSEPGFTIPAKVVPTSSVIAPTLMVPTSEPIASKGNVSVTNSIGQTATVPVLVAPVVAPVLAVPK